MQGGISNGEIIHFKVSFKPTPSIGVRHSSSKNFLILAVVANVIGMHAFLQYSNPFQLKQNTVSREHQNVEFLARGRHDPCVAPRGNGTPPRNASSLRSDLFDLDALLSAAVPVVESMAALVLMDQLMAHIAQCEMFPLNIALQESVGRWLCHQNT